MNPFAAVWERFVDFFRTAIETFAGAYSFLGDHRWTLAIITLTLIVRTLLLPVAIKQIRSMREQQRLQPEIQRIRQKHRNDRQKQMEEMQALFQREGVNPYAACLPMIAQAPVFMAMFYVIRDLTSVPRAIARQLEPIAKETGQTIVQLAQARGIVPEMPFLGLGDLSQEAYRSVGGVVLLAVMTATQFISTRQLNVGGTDQQRRVQQLLPFFFVFIMYRFPTALVLYWATQNIYQFVQQMIMLRGLSPAKWFSSDPVPVRPASQKKAAEPKQATAAPTQTPPPSATSFGSSFGVGGAGGFGDAAARQGLAEKRKRRRKKKRKRKR